MPGETIRLVDPDGSLHDVSLDAAAQALQDPRWKVASHEDEAGRVAAQAREANYGGVGGALKAGGAAFARGVTVGGSDVLARAIGGEDAAIELEGLRTENPGVSLGAEIIGGVAPVLLSGGAGLARGVGAGIEDLGARAAGLGAERVGAGLAGAGASIAGLGAEGGTLARIGSGTVGQVARLTPAGLTEAAGSSLSAAVGGGLRGALAAGVTEGAIAGTGTGISELALSRDPLTFERAASTLGSNALFGAAIGGGLGVTANAVERGLHRAGTAIDDYVAKRMAREALAPDLVGLDRKGLKLAEDAELARVEAERVTGRSQVADEIAAFRDELREQKIWLTTKKTKAPDAPEVPASPPTPEPPPRASEPSSAWPNMWADEFDDWRGRVEPSLIPDERKAVDDYTGGAYGVNRVLRTGEATSTPLVRNLDAAIAKAEVPADVVVHRGVHGDDAYRTVADLKPGDYYTEPGFTSTAVSPDNAFGSDAIVARLGWSADKVKTDKTVNFKIALPRGSKGMPTSADADGFEQEIILPRGQQFKVTEVERYPDGQVKRVHMAVEPPEGVPSRQSTIPEYRTLKSQLDQSGEDWVEQTVPASKIAELGYYEPPGAGVDAVRVGKARQAITEGQREPISLLVTPSGKVVVEGGRHRLAAAIELDKPIKVKWSTGYEPSEDMVLRAPHPPAPPAATPPAPTPVEPPQIEGLGPLGKRLLKTDRALDRLLDNPKALAARPQRALDALQMQEAAYEDILDKAAELRIKFAADTSGERLAALDSIPAALELNRALQGRIGEMLQAPRTPRLDAIAEAREILNQPEPPKSFAEQALSGTMFGAIASAASAVPVIGAIPGVAQFIGAKGAEIATRVVFGKMGASVGAQAERAGNIVKGLLDVTTAVKPYAPVVATKVLSALRYGADKGEGQPTTLPALFKARTDEIKELTAYDEAGVPRMRPAVRQALGDKLRPIAAIDPLMADRLETKIANRIEYLSGIIPRRPDIGGVQAGPDNWHPSDMAMRSWARSAAAAEDPYGVLERAITGTLTPEDAEVMRAVHPEILGDFVNQVMSKLPELRQTLPYHRKLSLSILTGVPVDPAMDPKVLRVLQRQFPDEVGSAGGTQAPKAEPQFGSMKATANQMSSPAQQRSQGAYG